MITEEYVIRSMMPRRALLATATLAKVLVRIRTFWARSWIITILDASKNWRISTRFLMS